MQAVRGTPRGRSTAGPALSAPLRHPVACAALLAVVLALGGCGTAGTRAGIVARVGATAISKPEVAHWMSVLAPEHRVPDPPGYGTCIAGRAAQGPAANDATAKQQCAQLYRSLRRRALDYLISSAWLLGEAGALGLPVSGKEVSQGLSQQRRSLPGGEAEYRESLTATGRTERDAESELRAQLAAEKIRRSLAEHESEVTPAQIVAYYRRHIERYHRPESRYFYILENLESATIARQRIKAIAEGKVSLAKTSLHEMLHRQDFAKIVGLKRILYRAIFAAKRHRLVGPVVINRYYFLFEVTRITPPEVAPLARVSSAIARQLTIAQRQRTLSGFIAAWRARWTAKTNCTAGYIVQKCRQYSGPLTPEDPVGLE